MTRDDILTTVLKIIKEHLELDATEATRFEDLGMDSLDRIDLVDAIEQKWDVEMQDDATYDMPSVARLVDHLHEMLGVSA